MATPAPDRIPAASGQLAQVLLDAGLITDEQFEEARQLMEEGNSPMGSIIAQRNWVSPQSLAMALSLYLNLPLIDLTRH
ncbi:MAG: hypothetical protein ACC647_07570, partial [Anaerolineales bacterium]